MSLALKSKKEKLPSLQDAIRSRNEVYQILRDFFKARQVMEVETPLLCQYAITDPFIDSFQVNPSGYFLQTSPEYAMKRLLVEGVGDIFQITKAFRVETSGHKHNPEFTMLEWYRAEFNHHQLMDEMDELLQLILKCKNAERVSYQHLFLRELSLDPFAISLKELQVIAHDKINLSQTFDDPDTYLQLLFSHGIEPSLGFHAPCFIYDFPPSQAALACIREDSPRVGERFEVYIQGTELANGFHELQNAAEQLKRFQDDQQKRRQLGLKPMEIDHRFINALQKGLPACSGVALGLDRLLMLKMGVTDIQSVLCFPWNEA